MGSRSELARNNIRTGVFVSTAIALAVASVVAVSGAKDRFLTRFHEYKVTYSIVNGVGGLEQGSSVRVGGMIMGEVLGVEPQTDNGPVQELEVTFKLNDRITLYEHADIVVNSALIGSDSWIDIRGVGTGETPWPHDVPIDGYEASAMLASVLGHVGARKATDFVEFLGDLRREYEERVVPTLTNLEETTTDTRELLADLNQDRWPRWADSIEDIAVWAGDFTLELDAAMADGRRLFGTFQDTVDENRPALRETMDNSRDITEHLNENTLGRFDALLEHGTAATRDAAQLVDTFAADYEQWAADFGLTMANSTLASQQLKLATVEVRRNPWKILYRPDRTELSHEMLYEAARSFAMATADLRATSEAIQRVVNRQGTSVIETEPAFKRLLDSLNSSMDRYTEAQENLLTVLKTEAGE